MFRTISAIRTARLTFLKSASIWVCVSLLAGSIGLIGSELDVDGADEAEVVVPLEQSEERPLVYVIPVTEAIDQTNLFILRRGQKSHSQ